MRKCPICAKPVPAAAEHYPFCSARCKTIDLGAWAAEEYVVSRPLTEADEKLAAQDEAADRPEDE